MMRMIIMLWDGGDNTGIFQSGIYTHPWKIQFGILTSQAGANKSGIGKFPSK
jgi:hypothetical protein